MTTKKTKSDDSESRVLRIHLLVTVASEDEEQKLLKKLAEHGEVAKVVQVQKPEDLQRAAESTPASRGVNPPGQQGPVHTDTSRSHDAYGNVFDGSRPPEFDAYGNRYDGGPKDSATHDAYGNKY